MLWQNIRRSSLTAIFAGLTGAANQPLTRCLYALRNRYGVMRIGITTGKKLGNAVERNRCRRIIRAAFRQLEGECCGGWDIVFVARHKTVSRKSTDIERSMRKQLGALGVIGISAGVKVVK